MTNQHTYAQSYTELMRIRAEIEMFFAQAGVGALPLDTIVNDCLAINRVVAYLDRYPNGSVEYFYERNKILAMIKDNIRAWIDRKMEKESA